jgi:hypothetical protein
MSGSLKRGVSLALAIQTLEFSKRDPPTADAQSGQPKRCKLRYSARRMTYNSNESDRRTEKSAGYDVAQKMVICAD